MPASGGREIRLFPGTGCVKMPKEVISLETLSMLRKGKKRLRISFNWFVACHCSAAVIVT